MDMRSRLLAVAACGVFAVVLSWGAYALQQTAERTEKEMASMVPADPPRTSPPGVWGQASAPSRSTDSRAESLRMQLQRLTARENRLSDLLEQKSVDYDKLKADYDHNAELLRALLEQSIAARRAAPEAPPETDKPEPAPAESAAEALARLNAELREMREELASKEKEASLHELQYLELEERERFLKLTASTALARAGAAAVPALADLLSHRRPEIRRWAATVIGEIGPDAEAAAEALNEALSDPDEEVRHAVRKALLRIEAP